MITEMNKQLNTIQVGSILAADQLRELHGAAKAAQARLRELITLIELSCIEHIETTGHDIELVDGKRWYVGTEKKIKAIDDTMILQAVLESSGGDVMKLTTGEFGVLCSSPWKNGAVKQLIGQAKFDQLFLTTTVHSLETGKAAKVLKVVDPAFLKGGTQ